MSTMNVLTASVGADQSQYESGCVRSRSGYRTRAGASWMVLRAGLKRVELQVQRRRKCSTFSQQQIRHAQLNS